MKTIVTDVTYIGIEDLSLEVQKMLERGLLKPDDIEYYHIADHSPYAKKVASKLSLIILKVGGKYKVLKSRY